MLFVFLQNLNMFSGFWSSIHGLLFGFTLQAALKNGGTMTVAVVWLRRVYPMHVATASVFVTNVSQGSW